MVYAEFFIYGRILLYNSERTIGDIIGAIYAVGLSYIFKPCSCSTAYFSIAIVGGFSLFTVTRRLMDMEYKIVDFKGVYQWVRLADGSYLVDPLYEKTFKAMIITCLSAA